MSQLSTPDVAIGWITGVGAMVTAATAAGFTAAGLVDRIAARRIWPLRLGLGAAGAVICAFLTPLAYMPVGDYGADLGQAVASALRGGRGLLDQAILDLFASFAAGLSAYVVALALVLIPTAPALAAWRTLARERLPARVRAHTAR